MPGPRQEHFRMFALYNRWANDRIYETAGRLTPAALQEDRGAFFKSVLGTLNHLLVSDRIWMSRLEGNSPRSARLDEILHADLDDLAQARTQENQRIIAYVFALEEEKFAAPLEYLTTAGTPMTQPLHHILAHLFNHQTHHRGQAHDLINQIAGEAPVLDLIAYQRFAAENDAP